MLKITKLLIVLTLLISIFSCKNSKNNKANEGGIIKNNIDCLFGFNNNLNITQGKAHSGVYFSKIDTINRFSLTFVKQIKDIYTGKVGSLKASVWVSAKSLNFESKLVVATTNTQGQNTSWNNLNLKEIIKAPSDWVEAKLDVDINSINPEDNLAIYIWNTGKEEVYVDDFEIEFFERK